MSLLSSHTLFHFTPAIENLQDILQNGFKYSVVAERLVDSKIAYFVNEICFCNIPLSMISEHVEWYGSYAIGLKKSVAREFGITPAFYIHSKSPQVRHTPSKANVLWYKDNSLTKYFKCEKGKQYKHSSNKYEDKKFYDEKEWKITEGPVFIESFKNNAVLFNRKQEIALDTNMIISNRLQIGIDDIEYIILDNKNDMTSFHTFIRNTFPNKVNDILPKVLFYSQIKRDF